jgi:hypothetical protein
LDSISAESRDSRVDGRRVGDDQSREDGIVYGERGRKEERKEKRMTEEEERRGEGQVVTISQGRSQQDVAVLSLKSKNFID